MPNVRAPRGVLILLLTAVFPCAAIAQSPNPEQATLDTLKQRTDISASDQESIGRWIRAEMERFIDFPAFRKRLMDQYSQAGNTEAFKQHFALRTVHAATTVFATSENRGDAAHALAQVLVDMDRSDVLPGFIAGLKSPDARARFVCARGLVAQKKAVGADKAKIDSVLPFLREAGLAESNPIVLGRMYEALGFPPAQAPAAFDAYLALFDKRMALRKNNPLVVDGAEWYAYEYFRTKSIASALNANQQQQLAARLAVFLRFDAERYEAQNLSFDEVDTLERCLDGVEEILSLLVGDGKGGKIRDVLGSTGHTHPAAIQPELTKWIGSNSSNEKGVLNDPPWNIPPGAP